MALSYEEQRRQNIAENEALLKSLGLSEARIAPKKAPARPKPKPKPKRKEVEEAEFVDKGDDSESDEEVTPRRSTRARTTARRYATAANGTVNGGGKGPGPRRRAASPESSDEERQPQRKAQRLGVRTEDPKQFGHIPGIEVGTWWPSRMDCSTDAVHAPTVAGISGNAELGAWSVALSGGYPDDVDLGEAFTYTGSGGRDLKGTRQNPKNLRTAPQTFDQSFENSYNASLKTSSVTKKPVRVIRGFKLDSPFAPAEGYRYDGLYVVERAWMAPGLTNGLKVCKYAFRRLPGQPPLPRNDVEEAEAAAEAEVGREGEAGAEEAKGEAEEAEGEAEEGEVEGGECEGKGSSEEVEDVVIEKQEEEEEGGDVEEKQQAAPPTPRNRAEVVIPTSGRSTPLKPRRSTRGSPQVNENSPAPTGKRQRNTGDASPDADAPSSKKAKAAGEQLARRSSRLSEPQMEPRASRRRSARG